MFAIPRATLAASVGTIVNIFPYSDDKDEPSLQIVALDGPTIQLDPV